MGCGASTPGSTERARSRESTEGMEGDLALSLLSLSIPTEGVLRRGATVPDDLLSRSVPRRLPSQGLPRRSRPSVTFADEPLIFEVPRVRRMSAPPVRTVSVLGVECTPDTLSVMRRDAMLRVASRKLCGPDTGRRRVTWPFVLDDWSILHEQQQMAPARSAPSTRGSGKGEGGAAATRGADRYRELEFEVRRFARSVVQDVAAAEQLADAGAGRVR